MMNAYARLLAKPQAVAMMLLIVFACGKIYAQVSSNANTVVARVNGDPIYVIDVEQQIAQVLRGREATPEALRLMQAQATEQLISRQLILQALAEKKIAANDREIEVEIDRIRKRLAVTGGTLDEHIKKTGQDIDSLQRTLRWQLSWQRYVDHYLDEENLQKFYGKNRRQFDGTELRVAHILWKVDVNDAQALSKAQAQAAEVRRQITSKEFTFNAAAAKHSQAPTAESGGKIGFITRHDSMPEPFAHAAFDLEPGQISPPVVTPFGVHLIQCQQVKPGQKPWRDVRAAVKLAATKYLFDWMSTGKIRDEADVSYTGALPYFKPGTREVVR